MEAEILFFQYIHMIFSQTFFWVLCGVIFIYFILQRHYRFAKAFILSLAFTTGIIFFLKWILKVPRPDTALIEITGYAFPSGHAGTSFFLAVFLSYYIVYCKNRSPLVRTLAVLSLGTVATLISTSRIILGVHTLDQVVVGALIGISVTVLVFKFTLRR